MARPTGGEQQAQAAAPAASGVPPVPPQQRSPHVNMAVPPGHGGGAVYPPTPLMAADHQIGAPWSSGLFDCDQDQTNAVVTAFFPCVTYGQIAEILDNGKTTCLTGSILYLLLAPALCSCWVLGSRLRTTLRSQYNLVQAPEEDWVVHLFCPCCALCQEFRELKRNNIDPSLGYWGNVALQNAVTQPPNVQQMKM